MTVTKLSHFTGLPRATVYRRLENLIKIKKIVRQGRRYYYAPNAMFPDTYDSISTALHELCGD